MGFLSSFVNLLLCVWYIRWNISDYSSMPEPITEETPGKSRLCLNRSGAWSLPYYFHAESPITRPLTQTHSGRSACIQDRSLFFHKSNVCEGFFLFFFLTSVRYLRGSRLDTDLTEMMTQWQSNLLSSCESHCNETTEESVLKIPRQAFPHENHSFIRVRWLCLGFFLLFLDSE